MDDEAGTAHSVGRMFLFLSAYSYVSVVIRVFKSMHCVIVSKGYQLKLCSQSWCRHICINKSTWLEYSGE